MPERSLEHYLANRPSRTGTHAGDLDAIVSAIAACAARQAEIIARRGLERDGAARRGGGDAHALTRLAHELYVEAVAHLPLTFIASEKIPGLIEVDRHASLALAIDPLDGFANIDTSGPIGALFTVLATDARGLVGRPLERLVVAAGMFLFGPQTRLLLSLGAGCLPFLLDPAERRFVLTGAALQIPPGRREFAINSANYRYWDDSVRGFIDDCIAGENGPLGEDFNMRWSGSLVAEAYRILVRGGLFLYPSDARAGYHRGRLRLLFDALPLALLIEQAGGIASDGGGRILDLQLDTPGQKTPLIFGSDDRVREVIDYVSGDALDHSHFPLFDHRSLFRHQGP